jgi:hypothetical protein
MQRKNAKNREWLSHHLITQQSINQFQSISDDECDLVMRVAPKNLSYRIGLYFVAPSFWILSLDYRSIVNAEFKF